MTASDFARKVVLLSIYFAVMIYAFIFAPGSLFDISSIKATLSGPEEAKNPIFSALFSMLMPVGFGTFALLSAGAPAQQTLSTEFFGSLASFLGFYGAGWYIALRNYAPCVSPESIRGSSWIVRFMEHWVSGALILAYSLRVYISLLFQAKANGLGVAEFARLLKVDRYVFATTIDLVILTIVGVDLLVEDMRRRGWLFDGANKIRQAFTAVSILAVPGTGLGVYVLIRPKLK